MTTTTTTTTYCMATLADFENRDFACSDWITVDQKMINGFADTTGDHQWIHVDAERCAKESPYGVPIAHGFLTLSLLAKLLMDVGLIPEDATQAINAGVNNVRFSTPVRAGQRVRARVKIGEVMHKGKGRVLLVTDNVLEIENEQKVALTADITLMMFGASQAKETSRGTIV